MIYWLIDYGDVPIIPYVKSFDSMCHQNETRIFDLPILMFLFLGFCCWSDHLGKYHADII